MKNNVPEISIIGKFVKGTFEPSDIGKLWNTCPNHMLWEAISADSATFLSQNEVLENIEQVSDVYILPEPLPALYGNTESSYTLVSSVSLIASFLTYAKTEPLYLISKDFSWMIVLTTEYTPSGEQVCVLLKNSQRN